MVENNIEKEYLEHSILMSKSVINICLNNGLYTLKDIIVFYRKNQSFKKLKLFNSMYELELSIMCKKFGDGKEKEVVNLIFFETNFENFRFNFEEIEAVKNYIDRLIAEFSNRTRNRFLQYFDKKKELNEIINEIYFSNFDFSKIQNAGTKSVLEFIKFKNELWIFIVSLKENILTFESSKTSSDIVLNNEIIEIINKLDQEKKAILEKYAQTLFINLSERSKNGLTNFFQKKSKKGNMYYQIFFSKIKTCVFSPRIP